MKTKIKHITSQLLYAIAIVSVLSSCQGKNEKFFGLDEKYHPIEPYLNVDFEEFRIQDVDMQMIEITIDASSAWEVSSSEEWAEPRGNFYMGATEMEIDVVRNRDITTQDRKATITVKMTTANNVYIDEFDIIQGVSNMPEINTDLSKITIGDEEGISKVNIWYNYGFEVTSNVDWIKFGPSFDQKTYRHDAGSTNITLQGEDEPYELEFKQEECGANNRNAIITITSIFPDDLVVGDGEILKESIELEIDAAQLSRIDPVIQFAEHFARCTENYKPLIDHLDPKMLWRVQQTDPYVWLSHYLYLPGWELYDPGWTNAMVSTSGAGKVGYLILPPLNVKETEYPALSFYLGSESTASTEDPCKLELVVSTTFGGDAFSSSANWIVLKDLTYNTPGTLVIEKESEVVSLSDYVDYRDLTVAFRYSTSETGYAGYRLDNVRFGMTDKGVGDLDEANVIKSK